MSKRGRPKRRIDFASEHSVEPLPVAEYVEGRPEITVKHEIDVKLKSTRVDAYTPKHAEIRAVFVLPVSLTSQDDFRFRLAGIYGGDIGEYLTDLLRKDIREMRKQEKIGKLRAENKEWLREKLVNRGKRKKI